MSPYGCEVVKGVELKCSVKQKLPIKGSRTF